jgi:hypothetical protein
MAVDGTWIIKFRTPGGERSANLILSTEGTTLTGSFDGAALDNGHVDGTAIGFTAQLTTPFKVKIKCAAEIEGDTITGKAKAAIMTIPFTGTRSPA